MFLFIDNYDSFSPSLIQLFVQLGRTPVIIKNDDPALLQLAQKKELSIVCISSGAGTPKDAGLCLEFLSLLPKTIPVLGISLGHQILAYHAKALIMPADEVAYGVSSKVFHTTTGLFSGITSPMTVGRYHSSIVQKNSSSLLSSIACTANGDVMGIAYNNRPWVGIQFQPESVLTPEGIRLLANFPSAILAQGKQNIAIKPINKKPRSIKSKGSPVQMSVILENLANGKNLTREEASEVFCRLMEGDLSLSHAGAFLMGLRAKGETPTEVAEAATAILARAVPVPYISGITISVVGTGCDNNNSFNCSTATSLILAGMGYKTLKHGNRSVSSRCGSADVLEKLGVPLDTPPEIVGSVLERDGFVFLFAPQYHPAFRHVMPVRRELGIRTLFNFLGPLVTPANPTHHMLGVADPNQVMLMAKTLAQISPKSFGVVLHGAGGYDELTTLGKATLVFVRQGKASTVIFDPAKYGFSPCSKVDLVVNGQDDAVTVLRKLLAGQGPTAMLDMLALNVGLALYLLGLPEKEDIDEKYGYDHARMTQAMDEAKKVVANGAGKKFCSLNELIIPRVKDT